MAAEADGALHVALQRDKNRVVGNAALLQFARSEAHHNLRAAHERDAVVRIERCARDERGDDADMPAPRADRAIDRDRQVEPTLAEPFQFSLIEDIGRRARLTRGGGVRGAAWRLA